MPDPSDALASNVILVIDDDTVSLELMTRSLTRLGLRVLGASSGEEGLRRAREVRPLAIFLDVVMPRLDGWAVLALLKADPELASIPVVMATMLDERNKALTLGVTHYLLKPVERTRLNALIEQLRLDQRPQSASPVIEEARGPILIIEDDAANREYHSRVLRKQGLVVLEAENGPAALQHIAQSRPALIVLDMMLPGMDGPTFIQELHKNEAYRSIPILVVTAKDLSRQDRQQLGPAVRKVFQKGTYRREDLVREVKSCQTEAVAANG